MPDPIELSERELEILKLVATGASNKEIAQQLFISANTVKVHLRNIFAKIEVASRTEAAMYAVNNGLVDLALAEESVTPPESRNPSPNGGSGGYPVTEGVEGFSPSAAQPDVTRTRIQRMLPWLAALGAGVILLAVIIGLLREDPTLPAFIATPPDTAWQELAPLSQARYALGVVASENFLYAIGGITPQGVTGASERYDPAANQWEELPSKPTPAGEIGAAAIGGRIFVPGGRLANGEVTDVLEIYDPLQGAWQTGASLPVGLSAYALAGLEGKLYVFGGWDGEQFTNTVFQYDPNQDAWQEMTPMPTVRGYASAVLVGNRIYVLGGYDGQSILPVNEQYAPNADLPDGEPWSSRAPLPEARYGMGAAAVADTIHVVGGETTSSGPLFTLRYLPLEDAWQELDSPLAHAQRDLGLVQFGTHLYLVGGQTNGVPSPITSSYQVIYIVVLPIIR